MFDLGDDFVLENFKVPWLIWIQILVMFLLTLTILVTYFDIFVINSSSTTSSSDLKISSSCSPSTQLHQQVAGNHDSRREITTTPSNRVRSVGERDGSSVKDLPSSTVLKRFFHPCRYFDFAKEAFLKCLGLGSGSHKSLDEEDEQDD